MNLSEHLCTDKELFSETNQNEIKVHRYTPEFTKENT